MQEHCLLQMIALNFTHIYVLLSGILSPWFRTNQGALCNLQHNMRDTYNVDYVTSLSASGCSFPIYIE
jgi:hypothetical protein